MYWFLIFRLRRLKEDVEKSIPVKEETVIEVELYVLLCGNLFRTTMQKKWYKGILERNFTWLKAGTKTKNMPNLMNVMMELRKCCIHPFLLVCHLLLLTNQKGAEDQIISEYNADTPEKQFLALIQASGKMGMVTFI
jgi:SNF2 family DNA or RNA helicase